MNELNEQPSSKDTYKPHQWLFLVLVILMVQPLCSCELSQSSAAPKTTHTLGKLRKPSKQKSILDAILAIIKNKKIPGGTRTTRKFCPIAPGVIEAKSVIWSDRPLFAWRGSISSLQVRPYVAGKVFEEELLLWEPTVNELAQGTIDTNISLKPGQRYDWQVIYSLDDVDKPIKLRRTYQVMASPQRDHIATALQALESQLKSEGAIEDEVALARAKYFLEQDLWSDALQQIYPIRNHSPDIMQLFRAVGDRACQA